MIEDDYILIENLTRLRVARQALEGCFFASEEDDAVLRVTRQSLFKVQERLELAVHRRLGQHVPKR